MARVHRIASHPIIFYLIAYPVSPISVRTLGIGLLEVCLQLGLRKLDQLHQTVERIAAREKERETKRNGCERKERKGKREEGGGGEKGEARNERASERLTHQSPTTSAHHRKNNSPTKTNKKKEKKSAYRSSWKTKAVNIFSCSLRLMASSDSRLRSWKRW